MATVGHLVVIGPQLVVDIAGLSKWDKGIVGRAELRDPPDVGFDFGPLPRGGILTGEIFFDVAEIGVVDSCQDGPEDFVSFEVAQDGYGPGGMTDQNNVRVAANYLGHIGEPHDGAGEVGVRHILGKDFVAPFL